jgi:predicted nucleic-acid-binding protein
LTLFVADVVLCELAWFLASRHKLSRVHIAEALENLLAAELIVVAEEGVAHAQYRLIAREKVISPII